MSRTMSTSAESKNTTKNTCASPYLFSPSYFPFTFQTLSRILFSFTVLLICTSRLHWHYHVDPEDPISSIRPILVTLLIIGAATLHHFISVKYVNELLLVVQDTFGFVFGELTFFLCAYLQTVTFMQLCSNGLGLLRDVHWRYGITRPASVWLLTQFSWFAFSLVWRRLLVGPTHKCRGASPVKRVLHICTLIMPALICIVGLFHTITPVEINNTITYHSNILSRTNPFELKIFQLSDIHLGPFMSKADLQEIVRSTLEKHPDIDLVALTGDFYTVESSREPKALSEALVPLKTFSANKPYTVGWACPGNHDHDVQHMSREELKRVNVNMLVDEQRIIEVRGEKVQIIGLDYLFKGKAEKLANIYRDLAAQAQGIVARIVLLHNPTHFKFITPVDIVPTLILSGHLHGGQFGLRSFPFVPSDWTVLRVLNMPDFGFYYQDSLGRPRKFEEHAMLKSDEIDVDIVTNEIQAQYVHSGTGFYGLPIRIGTQSERGVLTMRIEATENED